MSARELAALVFLAVLAAVGAIGATAWDISRRAHLLPPQPAFADFDQAKGGLVQIRIETAEEAVTLVRADGDRWTVEEADFFPAKSPTVNRLVKGMRDLQLVEPKTNLPANHARLMVADPAEVPGGTRFTSYDLNGDVVTDFVTGTYVSKPTPGEVSMLFIRNTAQDQVWLAEGDLSVATEVRQWLDQDLRLPEFDGVVSVEVKPLKAIAYKVERDAETGEFALAKTPKKFAKSEFVRLERAAQMFSFLAVEGVRERARVKFGKTDQAIFRTEDGLVVTARHAVVKDQHWVTISAEAEEGAAGDPAALNGRTADWVFQINPQRAEAIFGGLETLVVKDPA